MTSVCWVQHFAPGNIQHSIKFISRNKTERTGFGASIPKPQFQQLLRTCQTKYKHMINTTGDHHSRCGSWSSFQLSYKEVLRKMFITLRHSTTCTYTYTYCVDSHTNFKYSNLKRSWVHHVNEEFTFKEIFLDWHLFFMGLCLAHARINFCRHLIIKHEFIEYATRRNVSIPCSSSLVLLDTLEEKISSDFTRFE